MTNAINVNGRTFPVFKMTKVETTRKNEKFLYTIEDQKGYIIDTRRSNREYVAALVLIDKDGTNGRASHWFGRLDLVGKGDSKKTLDWLDRKVPAVTDTTLAGLAVLETE